jgi:hypothetical protein
MKKIIVLFFLCVAFLSIQGISYAQSGAPNGINYQAVIRNNLGTLVANTPVAIRINIRQNSASGVVIFSEKHLVTTTQYGLVNFVIGAGTFLNGGPFATINWGNGPYYLDLGVAFSGLPNPTSYMAYGTQQMMSVPFALYAKSSGNLLNQWKYGTGVPAVNLGTTGDYYLDTATGNVYSKTNGTMWILISNIMGPQGLTGATGPQGITGLSGPQGPQGANGATGLTGPAGAQGLTGPAGVAGPTGPIGLTGSTGPIGLTGPAGPTGPLGLTGPIGLTGPAGAAGAQGIQGLPGTNGAIGATGPIGPQGIQGLPGSNGAIGVTGPAGPQGIQGLPGPNGAVGATGPAGVQGIQGVTGPAGPAGAIGATGPAGTNGTNGQSAYQAAVSNGFVGTEAQWLTSLQGTQGIQGATGPIGLTGPAGAQGIQGLPGTTGQSAYQAAITNGFVGTEAQWLTSLQGAQGIQGITGATGPIGLTGPAGPQGIQGIPGTNGTNGAVGATGPAGPQGIQGTNGATGPIGLTGPAGAQGIQGLTGATGPAGPQGSAGGGLNYSQISLINRSMSTLPTGGGWFVMDSFNITHLSNDFELLFSIRYPSISASGVCYFTQYKLEFFDSNNSLIPFYYNFQKPVSEEKSGYGSNFISDWIAWDNPSYSTYFSKIRVFVSSTNIIKCRFSYNKFVGNNCQNYGPLSGFNWTFNYDLLKIE